LREAWREFAAASSLALRPALLHRPFRHTESSPQSGPTLTDRLNLLLAPRIVPECVVRGHQRLQLTDLNRHRGAPKLNRFGVADPIPPLEVGSSLFGGDGTQESNSTRVSPRATWLHSLPVRDLCRSVAKGAREGVQSTDGWWLPL
jgi:hypothetical protein